MANALQITNAEYVEVYIPTGNTKQTIYFPDLPNLRNRPIYGIEAYSAFEQAVSNAGYAVQGLTNLPNASITLYFDGGEFIVCPILAFKRISNNSGSNSFFGDIPNLAGQNIVWTKSYIQLNTSVASFANASFVFNVYYKR